MNPTLTIRPRFSVKNLKKLVVENLHYKSVNAFVEQAIIEKAGREMGRNSGHEKILSEIRGVLARHATWEFSKPTKNEIGRINKSRRAVESGREKTVSADEVLRMLRS